MTLGLQLSRSTVLLALGCALPAALYLLAGCESGGYSQGLLEEKRGGGVNDPYIVRDPGPKKPAAASTQPADPPPAR